MTAILVTGMHRSGTSMVTHVLRELGVYLGPDEDLIAADPANSDGYWEHKQVVALNDELLARLGGSWENPPETEPGWHQDEALADLREWARVITTRLAAAPTWAFKDPRTSLTLPFWLEFTPEARVLACVRNPLEVAASLKRRSYLSHSFTLQLWQIYNEVLLSSAPPDRIAVTHYEAWAAPEREIERLVGHLELDVEPSAHRLGAGVVDQGLRHHIASPEDLEHAGAPAAVVDLYERLREDEGHVSIGRRLPKGRLFLFGPASRSELEAVRNEVRALREEHRALHDRALAELARVEDAVHDVRDALLEQSRPERSESETAYRKLVQQTRRIVRETVPRDATVAVISKGDDELVRLSTRRGWHFPSDSRGEYAGFYPRGDLAAIGHLESVRARGAEFLVVPESARWWFEHYPQLARHIESRYERIAADHACDVFDLRCVRTGSRGWQLQLDSLLATLERLNGRPAALLDWNTGLDLAAALPGRTVFTPPTTEELPYLEDTIDVVALLEHATDALDEARRVTSAAVVVLPASRKGGEARVHWKRRIRDIPLPSVSIVIPCYDGLHHTRACLGTLLETLPADTEAEVIVVDDNSTDATREWVETLAAQDSRVRLVRNDENIGFLRSANRGAQLASGEVLVFLNNDTVLLPGWLEPLLRAFSELTDAGAVGGRLLYPSGALQEAGGLVFADGSAAKFGYGDIDPENALFTYLREVDYVSGCLLATPRSLFESLGGFDDAFAPGFYEDTDYCFAVRASGRRVYYQPESTIVHVEGGTAGTDLSTGMKRFQRLNESRFREKWSDELARQPTRPSDVLEREGLRALTVRAARVAT